MRAPLLFALSVLAAPAALAQEAPDLSVSGYVGAVSDYRWRGVSQTDNDPALQGGVTIEHPSGWHGDLWASTPTKSSSEFELDPGFGKSFDLLEGTLDLSAMGYIYPNLEGADYGSLAAVYERVIGTWTARARLEYAPPQSNLGEPSTYAGLEAEHALGETGIALIASVGWEKGAFTLDGEKWDYAVGGSYQLGPAAIALTYAGTDETAPVGETDIYGGRLNLGVSFGF